MKPTIIVLTPVRNESWILRRFLRCALAWADHVIIADQGSDDGSVEVARSFERVTVIENVSPHYNEFERQKLLIEAARHFPAPRLLFALDADEILSANVLSSSEWQTVLQMQPGTKIEFAKVELCESPSRYFLHSAHDKNSYPPFGYMDDGAEHEGKIIHTCRVPDRPDAPVLRLNEIVLMHYNQCNPPRSRSKDRWYRCFERLQYPEKSVVHITRLYDWHERSKPHWNIRASPDEWFAGYRVLDIDMSSAEIAPTFWWDREVMRLFAQHGTKPFRHLDVWDFDWEGLRQQGLKDGISGLPDQPIAIPRALRDRWVRELLFAVRRHPQKRLIDFFVKRICRFLG